MDCLQVFGQIRVLKIFNLTNQMKAGVVWANTYNKFDPTSPFGGYKESGHGREGGLHGLSTIFKIYNNVR